MLPKRRSRVSLLLSCLVLPLVGCTNSSLGEMLQRSLQADDPAKLQGNFVPDPAATPAANPSDQRQLDSQLPADFLATVPRYPDATLQAVVPATDGAGDGATGTGEVVTRWQSQDGSDRILAFYRQQLQSSDWQFDVAATAAQPNTLIARRNNQAIAIRIQPPATPTDSATNPSPASDTQFEIRYQSGQTTTTSPAPISPNRPTAQPTIPSFSDSTNLGAAGTSDGTPLQADAGPTTFTDLNKAPAELRQYVQEVAQLGVLTPAAIEAKASSTKANSAKANSAKANSAKSSDQFLPNKVVTRREFARWLASTNNRLYRDRAAQQIRQGLATAQPAFRDVSRSDPDFATIQGLAEAGIIPSRLSGDSTATLFRPNAPLTRETLLLWKVPMDMRQVLPTATIDAVKQTWGFQDAVRIDPKALRAVLADYQNGDLANIRRAFGYTTLFQPKKPVTRAEAAAALWYFGFQGEGISAAEALKGGDVGEGNGE